MRAEVKQDGDGVWYARPYLGRDASGKPVRPYRAFTTARSREEAQAMADQWAARLDANGMVRSARLADLLQEYVAIREANGAPANTVRTERYRASVVARHCGNVLAQDVTPLMVMRWKGAMLRPADQGGDGLSRSTVIAVHAFLEAAYRGFVGTGVVATSPMPFVAKTSPERREAMVLEGQDMDRVRSRLLAEMGGDALRDAAFALGCWVALSTGMRCGEVCALRRRDVRPTQDGGEVYVGGTIEEVRGRGARRREGTKSHGTRRVAVPADVVADVRAIEDRQDSLLGALGEDAPVVTLDGRWVRPSELAGWFSAMARQCGVKGAKFHSLRHTHATELLREGFDARTVSERLGHADVATTLRYYAHVLPGRDQAAADAFGRWLREAGMG